MADEASSEFRILLRGIKLKPEVEKRIEKELRQVVLRELASLDLKGDLTILAREKFPSIFGPTGGGLPGMIAERVK